MVSKGTLPASLLLQGPRGVGKQRLAVWLGQLLLCASPTKDGACGDCQSCRFSRDLTHPDLHWYFPRPRLKDSDADLADVREDYAEALAERAKNAGLYPPPSGSEGIYVNTVRAIVQQAAYSPAISKRKVFIVGDAERMVPQEGSEQAANAFLKLLEEPPADTVVILTSSESGALLPTIRSRVVAVRVPPVAQEDMREFLGNPTVADLLDSADDIPKSPAERLIFAGGAPGRLLAGATWNVAMQNARRMLDSVEAKPSARYEAAWAQASSGARGHFADTLDALSVALHERAKAAAEKGAEHEALAATKAIEVVEVAKERITTNASPQLITVNLIRELETLFA
jgi:DNA polymerase-3 subunit delta'